MPVILSDPLNQQETARTVAVRCNPVGTIRGYCVALANGKKELFLGIQHLDLDRALDAERRVGDDRVVVPGNFLARRKRALLYAYVGTLGDPVHLAGADIGFGHRFLRLAIARHLLLASIVFDAKLDGLAAHIAAVTIRVAYIVSL